MVEQQLIGHGLFGTPEPLAEWQRPDRFSGHRIRLPVYEGPLDLLLHLIRENQVDIYDIPISLITGQYLSYVALLEKVDIELAAEFAVVAATLMEIKSRLLLPVQEEEEGEEEDPRVDLVQRLIEYQRYREAADSLKRYREHRLRLFTRPAWADGGYDVRADDEKALAMLKHVSVFDLLDAFRECLDRVADEPAAVKRDKVTVGEKIRELKKRLSRATEPFTFYEACATCRNRAEVVATFLALLELVRRREVQVTQRKMFSELWLRAPRKKQAAKPMAPAQTMALSEAA